MLRCSFPNLESLNQRCIRVEIEIEGLKHVGGFRAWVSEKLCRQLSALGLWQSPADPRMGGRRDMKPLLHWTTWPGIFEANP